MAVDRAAGPLTEPTVVTGPSGRTGRPARWSLALVVVLSATAVGLLGWQVRAAQAVSARHEAILSAARQEAVNFTTLDYRSLDGGLTQVMAGATGTFRTDFQAKLGQLKSLITTNKAVSQGRVLEAGIVSDGPTSAQVALAVDSTVHNSAYPNGTQRHYRIEVDLVRVGGRWLTSNLQFVG
ncbi:MAG: hypothetical protein ACYCXA_10820 [Actinomycetes bacterium]